MSQLEVLLKELEEQAEDDGWYQVPSLEDLANICSKMHTATKLIFKGDVK